MTQDQLNALATYRTHKHCDCVECCEARKILAERDAKMWPKGETK